MSIRDKVAVVTGAGGGLGKKIVALFLADGARVVAVDYAEAGLAELEPSDRLVTVRADITSPGDVDRAVEAAGSRIDILCNNAGVLDRLGAIDDVTEDEWHRLIAVNLTGPFLMCHRVVPRMLERGGGVIVNTASVAGLRGARAGAAYTSSKFGLVGLTYNIAATLASRGIRCNAVCPGSMRTGMGRADEKAAGWAELSDRDHGKPAAGEPEEIARVVRFLAGDESSYVNGVAVPVDGGWIAY